jgi:hypothetical protein
LRIVQALLRRQSRELPATVLLLPGILVCH